MAPALEFAAVSETKSFSRKTTNKFSSGLHSKKGQECTDDLIDQQPVRNQMEKENMANKLAGANNIQPQPGQIDAGGPATGRATQKREQETEHKKKKEKRGERKRKKKREHKKKKGRQKEARRTKHNKNNNKGTKKKKKEEKKRKKKRTNTSTRKRKDQRPCPASNSQQTLAADHAKDLLKHWTKNAGVRVMKMFLTVHKCILFGKRRMTK